MVYYYYNTRMLRYCRLTRLGPIHRLLGVVWNEVGVVHCIHGILGPVSGPWTRVTTEPVADKWQSLQLSSHVPATQEEQDNVPVTQEKQDNVHATQCSCNTGGATK